MPSQLPVERDEPIELTIEEAARNEAFRRLGRDIRRINIENGWAVPYREDWVTDYKVPALLALIHSEVSEALEAFRADDDVNFSEEMADVVIRCLDLTEGLGIDLGYCIHRKLEINRQRAKKHGGKRI